MERWPHGIFMTDTILVSVPGHEGQVLFTREDAFRVGMALVEFATDTPQFQETMNRIFRENSVASVTEIK